MANRKKQFKNGKYVGMAPKYMPAAPKQYTLEESKQLLAQMSDAAQLTEGDVAALDDYIMTTQSMINMLLRDAADPSLSDEDRASSQEQLAHRQHVLDRLDTAIHKGRLPQATVLWRGLGGVNLEAKPGDILPYAAYMSTSTQYEAAEKYSWGGAILRINAPAGTHAIPTGLGNAQEVLLPRGTRIIVTHVDGDVIYADLLNGK